MAEPAAQKIDRLIRDQMAARQNGPFMANHLAKMARQRKPPAIGKPREPDRNTACTTRHQPAEFSRRDIRGDIDHSCRARIG